MNQTERFAWQLNELGEQIRQARVEKKITQADLAKAASVSRKLVSDLETGRATDCGYVRLCAIAEALGHQVTFERKPRLWMPRI